jgi:hypothetical protein
MTGKKASHDPGLVPIKGQEFDPYIGLILRVIKPIFVKLTLDRQPTEFREHPTNGSGS